MVDTFIANASADESVHNSSHHPLLTFSLSLRSIVRNLLATGPPGLAPAFTSEARSRLRQTNSKIHNSPYLFQRQTRDKPSAPMPSLHDLLTRARTLYGAGLGFASLGLLSSIVRATIGLRWEDDGDMADILAVIDADIGQAIQASLALLIIYNNSTSPYRSSHSQSSKEEIESGGVVDLTLAREAKNDLRCAVNDSLADVNSWGGEFPFERATASIEYWKF
jgi:hypothetical protein